MQVTFIRHGQSHGNVGLPCDSMAGIPLTDLGHEQAKARAASWTRKPSLIVVSRYLRTHETAAPTIARFPDVPVEEWPIHEFNHVHPDRWKGDPQDKWIEESRQWGVCDPCYCDRGGTESFSDFHQRAIEALDRFSQLPEDSLVYAFSHGYFMHAVRLALSHPELAVDHRMRIFRPADGTLPFANTATFPLKWDGGRWIILPNVL